MFKRRWMSAALLTWASAVAGADSFVTSRIEWKAYDGASSYEVIIEDEGGTTVLQSRTIQPSLEFKLPDGVYTYKIGIINKFGKVHKFSSEHSLVLKKKPPDGSASGGEDCGSVTVEYTGKKRIPLEWKDPGHVKSFCVEVNDSSGETLVRRSISNSSIEVKLDYGKYDYRIGFMNKLGQVFSWSAWNRLEINPPLDPTVEEATPRKLVIASRDQLISVRGKNFFKVTKVKLVGKNGEIPLKDLEIGSEEISFKIDLSEATPEEYKLVLENPLGRKTEEQGLFEVLDFYFKSFRFSVFAELIPLHSFSNFNTGWIGSGTLGLQAGLLFDRFDFSHIVPGLRYSLQNVDNGDNSFILQKFDVLLLRHFAFSRTFGLDALGGLGFSRTHFSGDEGLRFSQSDLFAGLNLVYSPDSRIHYYGGLEFLFLGDNDGFSSTWYMKAGLRYRLY